MLDPPAAMTANLYKMLSIAEANAIVQSSISPLESIDVNLLDATGYVLAVDMKAQEPLPPFPASIKVYNPLMRRNACQKPGLVTVETSKD